MKHLAIALLLLGVGCDNHISSVIRGMSCEWVNKYEFCLCVYTAGNRGYMTAVPDSICFPEKLPETEQWQN